MKTFAAAAAFLASFAWLAVTSARLRSIESRLAAPRESARPTVEHAAPRPASEAVPPPVAREPAPAAAPSLPAPATEPAELKESVVRVLQELRREEDARWQERLAKAGVNVLSKELALTRTQEELLAPVVEEHLEAIRKFWWPGTVVENGQERALTYDEKVKLSDEARAKVDARVRAFLDRGQAAAYETWSKAWREEAPKRAGEVGPLRWF
jgi:hypothetical protein